MHSRPSGRRVACRGAERLDSIVIEWSQVERLAYATDDIDVLGAHRLHLVAARLWRAGGRDVPQRLQDWERLMLLTWGGVGPTLRAAREAYDGRLVLMKGPEVAARYPVSTDRPFSDVDLLVDDASEAQRALLAAGFVEVGEPELYRDIHHLRPVALPSMMIAVELHSVPKWPSVLPPPPVGELLEAAVPSTLAIDGLAALRPEHHAICLAAHAWAHEPLARVGDLLDVALVTDQGDVSLAMKDARRWGMDRIFDTMLRTAEGTIGNTRPSVPQLTWARHLDRPRHRTVAGTHLTKWLAPFSAETFGAAVRSAIYALAADVKPAAGETWPDKAARGARAVANARRPRPDHELLLGDEAQIGNEVWARIHARRRE